MKAMILKGVSGFAENPFRPELQEYRLIEANLALGELKEGKIRGAKVLRIT